MNDAIRKELDIIARLLTETLHPKAIYLFGSYADGTQVEKSDFDIYVVIPDDGMRPLEAMQKANRALYPSQRRPVDVLVGRYSDFLRRRELPTIERTVYKTGKILYGG